MVKKGDILSFIYDMKSNVVGIIPSFLSEDKRSKIAYSTILALLVCSDKKISTVQNVAALECIKYFGNDSITSVAIKHYGYCISQLRGDSYNEVDFSITVKSLIEEYVNVKLSNDNKYRLIEECEKLVGGNSTIKELKMKNDIVSVLNSIVSVTNHS